MILCLPRCLENPVQTDPIMIRCPDVQLPSNKPVFTKFIEAKGSTPFPGGLSRSFFTAVYMSFLTQDPQSIPASRGRVTEIRCGVVRPLRLTLGCGSCATSRPPCPQPHPRVSRTALEESQRHWFLSHEKHSSKDHDTVTLAWSLNLREVLVFNCYFGLIHPGLREDFSIY